MKRNGVLLSYVVSLLWVIFLVAAVIVIGFVAGSVVREFTHKDPIDALWDSVKYLPVTMSISLLVAGIATSLVFPVPQAFEAFLAGELAQRLGGKAHFLVLLAVPLTAVLTWYCYDYFLPEISLGIYDGPDWVPYQHGLTTERYLKALAVQAPLTLFNTFYFDSVGHPRYRKAILLVAIVAVVIIGGIQASA